MKLADYISDIGPQKFAELMQLSVQQVYRYQSLAEIPAPKTARKIKTVTHGLVDFDDIYDPFFDSREVDPQLEFDLD